jgi:hypothetical protein
MEDTTTIWFAPPGGINPAGLSFSTGVKPLLIYHCLAMFDSMIDTPKKTL